MRRGAGGGGARSPPPQYLKLIGLRRERGGRNLAQLPRALAVLNESALWTLEIVPAFPRIHPIQHGLAIQKAAIALRAHEVRGRRLWDRRIPVARAEPMQMRELAFNADQRAACSTTKVKLRESGRKPSAKGYANTTSSESVLT